MQNFGRGMWRRVGDYERVQKPLLLQQARLEQWQQFVEYQTILKKYKDVQRIRQKKLQQNITKHPVDILNETAININTHVFSLDSSIDENDHYNTNNNDNTNDNNNDNNNDNTNDNNNDNNNNTNDNTNDNTNIQNDVTVELPSVIPKKTKRKNKNKNK